MESFAEFRRDHSSCSWMDLGAALVGGESGHSKKHIRPREKSAEVACNQKPVPRNRQGDVRFGGEKENQKLRVSTSIFGAVFLGAGPSG